MPPAVIEALAKSDKKAEVKLSPELAKSMDIPKIDVQEKGFRWLVNENEIGNDKLCEGIRLFTQGNLNIIIFRFFSKFLTSQYLLFFHRCNQIGKLG